MALKYEFCTSSYPSSDQISSFVFHYTSNIEKPPEISLADQGFPPHRLLPALNDSYISHHSAKWHDSFRLVNGRRMMGGMPKSRRYRILSWKKSSWRRGYRDGLIGRCRCMAIGDFLPDWGSGYYLTCRDQYPKSHKRRQHSVSQELWCDERNDYLSSPRFEPAVLALKTSWYSGNITVSGMGWASPLLPSFSFSSLLSQVLSAKSYLQQRLIHY